MLTVLLGGARSGKSSAALRIAGRSGGPVTYIATSPHIPGDHDLEGRIEVHRAERPSSWRTIEAELDLASALVGAERDHVIVDCLTVWLGNLVHHGCSDAEIALASDRAITVASERGAATTVVTNEVGMGIVPDGAMSRRYRDLLGRLNQRWVAASDHSYLVVAGRALELNDPTAP